MKQATLVTAFLGAVALLLGGPALAACKINDLPCYSSKCNIKFLNNTGKSEGSGGGTDHRQVSYATTIRLRPDLKDGSRAGKNTIEILAGGNKTMNLSKKKDFQEIRIWSPILTNFSKGTFFIECSEIRQILKNDDKCKIYVTKHTTKSVGGRTVNYYLAYNCGAVSGSSDKPFAHYRT